MSAPGCEIAQMIRATLDRAEESECLDTSEAVELLHAAASAIESGSLHAWRERIDDSCRRDQRHTKERHMSDDKTRTITMTDRPPVKIREREWMQIACATGDNWGASGDYARHQQALALGELDEYSLRVRQHEDGRAIVYGVLDAASACTGSEDRREGELCEPGADLAGAIRRVGERCGLPDSIIRECIADLPAEEL